VEKEMPKRRDTAPEYYAEADKFLAKVAAVGTFMQSLTRISKAEGTPAEEVV
jgi:hypothetical protein